MASVLSFFFCLGLAVFNAAIGGKWSVVLCFVLALINVPGILIYLGAL